MDPIERLTAADPLPEAERLTDAEQAEADALLARIVAEEPATKPARRARRHWLPAIAATAAAIALALVAIDVVDEDAPGPSVVDRAVAAVSVENSIYHTVAVLTFGHQHGYSEGWFGPRVTRQKLYAFRNGHRGKLILEEVIRPRLTRTGRHRHVGIVFDPKHNLIQRIPMGGGAGESDFPEIDPSKDPAAGLRELQREGRLRLVGSEQFEGRKVYRLVGDVAHQRGIRVNRLVYLVDAKTYYPVLWEWVFAQHGPARVRATARFTSYERLPATAESRKLLKMEPHPGARPDRDRDGHPDASGGSRGR
jgi:hypothetical protein